MTNLTAPRVAVDLGERVELVEEFGLYDAGILADWTVTTSPDVDAGGMVLRWDHVTVTVRERGDLELARRIAVERAAGLSYVRTAVALARAALGWGQGEPAVRCVVCRTSAPASQQHTPGGPACEETRRDRMAAWSE